MRIMCDGADRLARCEAKKIKVREKLAPQCFTGFKACFSTQLNDRLRWTFDHCCIDDGLRRLLIRRWAGARRLRHHRHHAGRHPLRRHHRLHSAGRRLAAGFSRLLDSEGAPTTWPPRPPSRSQPPIRAHNPSHWSNTYTLSLLWRIHPQRCGAAFIPSAAIA
jgi:hypothetical protein